MPLPWKPSTRTIGVRQLLVGIAFFALVLALGLQSRRARQVEARLRAERDQAHYELHNLRSRMLTEAMQRREMTERYPDGTPRGSGSPVADAALTAAPAQDPRAGVPTTR